jgi:hypothetical protein
MQGQASRSFTVTVVSAAMSFGPSIWDSGATPTITNTAERIESIATRVAFDIMFGFAIEMINAVIY